MTAHVTKCLAHVCETVVFAYLGLSTSDPRANWAQADWPFIGIALLGCFLGRLLNIVPLVAIINCVRGPAHRLTARMQVREWPSRGR